VTPLAERLARVFGLPRDDSTATEALCERFLEPVFAVARVYDDVLPVLARLRETGLRTAIVSNTPWGSPSKPWRQELERLGLLTLVDVAVFCGDVGWRKPAREIFLRAAADLGVDCRQCVFVGDELQASVETTSKQNDDLRKEVGALRTELQNIRSDRHELVESTTALLNDILRLTTEATAKLRPTERRSAFLREAYPTGDGPQARPASPVTTAWRRDG